MRVCIRCEWFSGSLFLKHPEWCGITRVDVDLTNQVDTEKFFMTNKYDVVVHCAVKGGSMLVPEDGNITHDNILMFENVRRVFKGKMLYLSSGAGTRGNPPIDPYGLSKWILDKRIEHEDDVYLLRLFGCYGSGEGDPHNRDRFKTICKQKGISSLIRTGILILSISRT